MAHEYQLTLAGTVSADDLAARAFPAADERPAPWASLLTVDLHERYGFAVSVRSGRRRYIGVVSDSGYWEWEPESFAEITFAMTKTGDSDRARRNMLTVVRRVLDTGSEDMVLVLNHDNLIFARLGGVLVRHLRDTWWDNYPYADGLILGRSEP